jgi:hypothetical protein
MAHNPSKAHRISNHPARASPAAGGRARPLLYGETTRQSSHAKPAEVLMKSILQLAAIIQKAHDGVTNDWPAAITSPAVDGTTYTPATLAAKIVDMGGPVLDAAAKRAAYFDSLQACHEAMPAIDAWFGKFYAALPSWVGDGSTQEAFGGKVKKQRAKLTVEQNAAKAAKMRATRAARHTMSKKQKALITGQVPPATPPDTTPAPTPATTPAVSPNPAPGG